MQPTVMGGSNVECDTDVECNGGICNGLDVDLNDVESSFMRIQL